MKAVRGDKLDMIILDNSMLQFGYISCIERSEYPKLKHYERIVHDYCFKLPAQSYTPM